MVEDSGIFITALNGFPKTFVHFVQDTIGLANILKMMKGVRNREVEFRQSLAYIEPGMDLPKIFSYVDGGYTLADKIWKPRYESSEFDKILIPPGENKPLCMFPKTWCAKRDAEQNKERIHYHQLAHWLKTRGGR
jgi:inosine/xanthosine triphosphate pyrophosphatase family protein